MKKNPFKKKELNREKTVGRVFLSKKILNARDSSDLASVINSIAEKKGIEKAGEIYKAVATRKPAEIYYSLSEGKFVGFSVNNGAFIKAGEFFKNPGKYVEEFEKRKEKFLKRASDFIKNAQIKSDVKKRYEEIKEEKKIKTDFFYEALTEKKIGKITADSSLLTALSDVKGIFFVLKTRLFDEYNSLAVYSLKEKTKWLFPASAGFSLIGIKIKGKSPEKIYFANDLYEVEEFFLKNGIKNKEEAKDFLLNKGFVLLNGIPPYARIFYFKKEYEYADLILNDSLFKTFIKDAKEIKSLEEEGIGEDTKILSSRLLYDKKIDFPSP